MSEMLPTTPIPEPSLGTSLATEPLSMENLSEDRPSKNEALGPRYEYEDFAAKRNGPSTRNSTNGALIA